LLRRLLRALKETGAVVPVLPVRDATVEVDESGELRSYLDRNPLRAVQTPQAFERRLLEAAFAAADSTDHPDDASLVLAAGNAVKVVEGEESNFKVTTAEQLAAAIASLEARGPVTAEGTSR